MNVLKIIHGDIWHIISEKGAAIIFPDQDYVHISIARMEIENVMEYEIEDFFIDSSYTFSVHKQLTEKALRGVIRYLSDDNFDITEVYVKNNPDYLKSLYFAKLEGTTQT